MLSKINITFTLGSSSSLSVSSNFLTFLRPLVFLGGCSTTAAATTAGDLGFLPLLLVLAGFSAVFTLPTFVPVRRDVKVSVIRFLRIPPTTAGLLFEWLGRWHCGSGAVDICKDERCDCCCCCWTKANRSSAVDCVRLVKTCGDGAIRVCGLTTPTTAALLLPPELPPTLLAVPPLAALTFPWFVFLGVGRSESSDDCDDEDGERSFRAYFLRLRSSSSVESSDCVVRDDLCLSPHGLSLSASESDELLEGTRAFCVVSPELSESSVFDLTSFSHAYK